MRPKETIYIYFLFFLSFYGNFRTPWEKFPPFPTAQIVTTLLSAISAINKGFLVL